MCERVCSRLCLCDGQGGGLFIRAYGQSFMLLSENKTIGGSVRVHGSVKDLGDAVQQLRWSARGKEIGGQRPQHLQLRLKPLVEQSVAILPCTVNPSACTMCQDALRLIPKYGVELMRKQPKFLFRRQVA